MTVQSIIKTGIGTNEKPGDTYGRTKAEFQVALGGDTYGKTKPNDTYGKTKPNDTYG